MHNYSCPNYHSFTSQTSPRSCISWTTSWALFLPIWQMDITIIPFLAIICLAIDGWLHQLLVYWYPLAISCWADCTAAQVLCMSELVCWMELFTIIYCMRKLAEAFGEGGGHRLVKQNNELKTAKSSQEQESLMLILNRFCTMRNSLNVYSHRYKILKCEHE